MLVRMQNRMELLSCLKSIHGLKRRRPAGCSRLRSGPVRQRAGFSRVGSEVAASCRSVVRLPCSGARSSPACRCCSARLPGAARPLHLHSEFKDVRQIRASFCSCCYVQPTSVVKDSATASSHTLRWRRPSSNSKKTIDISD